MKHRRSDNRRSGRLPCRRWLRFALLTAGLGVSAAGCSTSSAPLGSGGSFNPLYAVPIIGAKAKEDALRKRVEADPFPTAEKAGL